MPRGRKAAVAEAPSTLETDGWIDPAVDDYTGEYYCWLSEDCSAFTLTVAGIAFDKSRETWELICGKCDARWFPPQPLAGGKNFTADLRRRFNRGHRCPKCDKGYGVRKGISEKRNVRKRVMLSDSQYRKIWDRANPDQGEVSAYDEQVRLWKDEVARVKASVGSDAEKVQLPPHPQFNASERERMVKGPKRFAVRDPELKITEHQLVYPFLRLARVEPDTDYVETAKDAATRKKLQAVKNDLYQQLAAAESEPERQKLVEDMQKVDERMLELMKAPSVKATL